MTINGGVIDVRSAGFGAGIGGGYIGNAGTVIINRGTVTAVAGLYAAGIGGGGNQDGGIITITGGTVTVPASGKSGGAGIGGGYGGNGGTITISGGTVTATGGKKVNAHDGSAGIGAGSGKSGCNITITGGTIVARGTDGGAGIGGAGGNSTYAAATGTIKISGGNIQAYGSGNGAGIGAGDSVSQTQISLTLNWTDASRQTMQVYASSFGDKDSLKLENSFKGLESGNVYIPISQYTIGSQTLVPTIGAYNWKTLQQCIREAEDGDVITLYNNCKAEDDDEAIYIPEGLSITLDLQRYTLDRNLSSKQARQDGSVIINDGTLTIISQTGYISGGNDRMYGGGIRNSGTLTVENTNIQNNKASNGGTGQGGGTGVRQCRTCRRLAAPNDAGTASCPRC